MRRTISRRKRIEVAGLAAFVVGAVLLGSAVMVSASGSSAGETGCLNSSCAIAVSPDSGLSFASPVSVNGSHFVPRARGSLMECNMAPGEPTIAIPDNKHEKLKSFGSLPVGCSPPQRASFRVGKQGHFASGIGINTNTVGPPASGTDSAGGSAAADAASYPCPPTQAQFDAGASCAIVFRDTVGSGTTRTNEDAFEDISFAWQFTTTTVIPSTTLTTIPGCDGIATVGSGFNSQTGTVATVTVTPGSCLRTGSEAFIAAKDLAPSSLGSIFECNSDPTQPTMSYLGATVPVSCSKPVLFTTGSDGGLPVNESFSAVEGTIGPPIDNVDSSGNSSSDDAANYPCPPTRAQVSAGDTCDIELSTVAGDKVNVNIFFNPPIGS